MSSIDERQQPRYAGLAKAAEYVDCSTWVIRKWLAHGLITPYRVGTKLLRVDLNEIDALMAAGK